MNYERLYAEMNELRKSLSTIQTDELDTHLNHLSKLSKNITYTITDINERKKEAKMQQIRTVPEWQKFIHNHAVKPKRRSNEHSHKTPMHIAALLTAINTDVNRAMITVHEGRLNRELDTWGYPDGLPAELANIVIRIFDIAEWLSINLDTEMRIIMNRGIVSDIYDNEGEV